MRWQLWLYVQNIEPESRVIQFSLVWECTLWRLWRWCRGTEAFDVCSGLLRSVAHRRESMSSNAERAHSKMPGYTVLRSTHQGQRAKFSFFSGAQNSLQCTWAPLTTAFSSVFLHRLRPLFNVCVVLAFIIHFTIVHCKAVVSRAWFPTIKEIHIFQRLRMNIHAQS